MHLFIFLLRLLHPILAYICDTCSKSRPYLCYRATFGDSNKSYGIWRSARSVLQPLLYVSMTLQRLSAIRVSTVSSMANVAETQLLSPAHAVQWMPNLQHSRNFQHRQILGSTGTSTEFSGVTLLMGQLLQSSIPITAMNTAKLTIPMPTTTMWVASV